MNKKKALIIVLLIIAVIMLIFVGIVLRKFFIINKILNRENEYSLSNNYYFKTEQANTGFVKLWYKDGMRKSSHENISAYIWSNGIDEAYIIAPEEKRAVRIDVDAPGAKNEIHYFLYYTMVDWDSLREKLLICAMPTTTIKTERYDNKECYLITIGGREKTWISKDTLFPIKSEYEGQITEFTEFSITLDIVTDEDVAKPDLTEYTIVDSK